MSPFTKHFGAQNFVFQNAFDGKILAKLIGQMSPFQILDQ